MDPNIRNFSEIEKLIKENPREADAQAFEWERFLKANAESSPEILTINSAEEFSKWTSEHPEKHIDPSIFVGKEILGYFNYFQNQQENETTQGAGKEMSVKETGKKFEEAFEVNYNPAPQQEEERQSDTQSQSLQRMLNKIRQEEMGPKIPEQTPQSPGRFPGRGFGRGANNLANKGINSLGRNGSRLAAQGGRVAAQLASRGAVALLATPVGWVIIAIVIIVVITFVIVLSMGGSPSSPLSPPGNVNPSIAPSSQPITPTPSTSPSPIPDPRCVPACTSGFACTEFNEGGGIFSYSCVPI